MDCDGGLTMVLKNGIMAGLRPGVYSIKLYLFRLTLLLGMWFFAALLQRGWLGSDIAHLPYFHRTDAPLGVVELQKIFGLMPTGSLVIWCISIALIWFLHQTFVAGAISHLFQPNASLFRAVWRDGRALLFRFTHLALWMALLGGIAQVILAIILKKHGENGLNEGFYTYADRFDMGMMTALFSYFAWSIFGGVGALAKIHLIYQRQAGVFRALKAAVRLLIKRPIALLFWSVTGTGLMNLMMTWGLWAWRQGEGGPMIWGAILGIQSLVWVIYWQGLVGFYGHGRLEGGVGTHAVHVTDTAAPHEAAPV